MRELGENAVEMLGSWEEQVLVYQVRYPIRSFFYMSYFGEKIYIVTGRES